MGRGGRGVEQVAVQVENISFSRTKEECAPQARARKFGRDLSGRTSKVAETL